MKPVRQTIAPDNQITTQIRPPHPNTATDYHHYPNTKSDHPISRPPPTNQTTDHHLPIRTAYPASWNGTGQVHSLWVGSRGGVYRALDELCKAYFPHTFGLTFRTFFRFNLNLIVVRLASGVPWAGKGLPFLFPWWVPLQVFGQQ